MLDAEVAHRSADVARLVLEGELGRVDAHDDEAVALVRVVPRLHVRELAEAVDTRVRPEVHEHDLPPQAGHRQRPPARCVEPERDVLEVGRGAVVVQLGLGLVRGSRPGARFAQTRERAAGTLARLDVILHCPRVAGDGGREVAVDVQRDRQRRRGDDDAEPAPQRHRVGTDGREPAGALAADREGERAALRGRASTRP